MRRRSIDRNNGIMGNGRGQRPMRHKMPILDENNDLLERNNVHNAIHGTTSRERVVATQRVVRPEAIREILNNSSHVDSRELARTKLRGLGEEI